MVVSKFTTMLVVCFVVSFLLCSANSYRTSVCLRKNEEFSLCGWKCPPTCVNMLLMPLGRRLCTSMWECRVGCRCSAGFIRDEYSQRCIPVEECPDKATCPPGETLGTNLQCITRRRTTITNDTHWKYYDELNSIL